MTNFTKLSALILGGSLLTLAACSTATPAQSAKGAEPNMQAKHQMMNGEHRNMMQQMKMDHDMMSKMDMSKMDTSKLSAECQTMVSKMKTKMADKHKDGSMHSGMKDHDMSKMKDHDMSKMKNNKDHDMGMMNDHDSEKMKAKMATHKQCMAEMKEAMPHSH
ncbi:MAG: hypothetical protein COB36_13280 [Alphaproteobacteria bacterium]|nr:MAG: hypothetical protein COB36_13280 [Alphaproteobacteria bacterium]